MKNQRVLVFFASAVFAIVTLYSGCGGDSQFSSVENVSSFCNKSLMLPVAPLKVMPQFVNKPFSDKKAKIFSKPGATLPAGSKYVFLINSVCLKAAPADSFSQMVVSQSGVPIEANTFAVNYELPESITVVDFENRVDSDSCIIGVTPPAVVKKASLLNDTHAHLQRHIQALSFDVAYQAFFNTQYAAKTRVKVAIVDTGVECTHPDLKCFKNSAAIGFPDLVDDDQDPIDTEGHGTNVAGILAGISNNKQGISGLSGNLVDVLAVRVLGSNGGELSDVYNGVKYAIDSGVDIINMSFGAVGEQPILAQAVQDAVEAGVFVVMAAGNDSCQYGQACTVNGFSHPAYKYLPGYVGDLYQGAITVGSVDLNGYFSSFSNYHPTKVEIAAYGSETPTDGIYSTWKGKTYQRERGTSQAAPQVSAAAALLISFYKTNKIAYTMASLEADLKGAVNKDPGLANLVSGGSVINFSVLSQLAISKLGKSPEEVQSIICKK